jgi:tetratricopeptide (TPR) repeat protein
MTVELERVEGLLQAERAHEAMGDRAAQGAALDELEAVARAGGGNALLADVGSRRAEWAMRTGRFSLGAEAANQAAQAAAEAGRPDLESLALRHGSMCLVHLGRSEEALEWAQRAVNLADEFGDDRAAAAGLSNLGVIALTLRFPDVARGFLEDAVTRWEAHAEVTPLAGARNNLAMALGRMGDYARALKHQREALHLVTASHNMDLRAHLLTTMGVLLHAVGAHDDALAVLDEAINLGRQARDPKIELYALARKGYALLGRGDLDEAEESFRQSLEIHAGLNVPSLEAEITAGLAETYLAAGRTREALDLISAGHPERTTELILELTRAEALSAVGEVAASRDAVRWLGGVLADLQSLDDRSPRTFWRAAAVARASGEDELADRLTHQGDGLLGRQTLMLGDPALQRSFRAFVTPARPA